MIGFRTTSADDLSIDHTIDVETLTGSARLTVPVRTSVGRDSFGPSLSLGYGSGGRNSPFGVGWSLSGVPTIAIDTTRQLPAYRHDSDRYVYAGGQELIPYRRRQGGVWVTAIEQRGAYSVQRFRARVERAFERFERWTHDASGRSHWLAYARNGVVSVFGMATDGSTRIADPADPDRRTAEWLLEARYDRKGNAVSFQYKPEDGAGVDPTLSNESRRLGAGGALAQRYLKRIRYGNSRPLSHLAPTDAANEWRFEVVLDYGEHVGATPAPVEATTWPVRADPHSTYRTGFEIRTYRLCRRVLMFHRFPELGALPRPVGATELGHREEPAGSVLESIGFRGYRTEPGGDATTDRAVPPLALTYAAARIAPAFESPARADNLPAGLYGSLYQWVDLRSEGLPGILHRQSGSWYFKENLGDGHFGPLETVDELPAAISAAFQLYDFDGDGDLNFVGLQGRDGGQYTRDRDTGRWDGFRPLRDQPRVDFANAHVQWVDLNGDGHDDLVVDHLDRLVWYPSEGTDGFGAPIELAKPDVRAGGAPTLTQDRRLHTFFADMTGDGLADMVCVNSGRVEYWPHLGMGRFGAGVVMENPPLLDDFGELDPARLRFADLDGSGTADIIYIGRGEIRYWINASGNRLGNETRLPNLPYIDQLASAQIFDFLGDGSTCLVWSSPLPTHEGNAIQYLRLAGGVPPRMLLSVSNGIGREAVLSYRSSAREYLRDKREGRPWRTLLPRHSMVVDQFEGLDHVGGTRMVTRYEYRDGYFDGEERRVVGFGLVDTLDTDQVRATGATAPEEVTPPSLVRSWFHTGALNGSPERAADFYSLDPLAARPPSPVLENVDEMTTEEQVDAYRALAGVQWRQEFYTIRPDDTRSPHPLRTTEFAYGVRREQPSDGERAAVFSIVQTEVLSHEYEEAPGDPRVRHEVVVDTSPYGDATRRATLAYPRRPAAPNVRAEQRALNAQVVATTYAQVDTSDRFEVGIEVEEKRYVLTGLATGASEALSRAAVRAQVGTALAQPLEFHEVANGATPQARLVAWRRDIYWNDALDAALPPGQVGRVALLHHAERAAFPDAGVNAAFGGRVAGALLAGDAHYRQAGGYWWSDDTTYRYRDAAAFYRLEAEENAGGGRQRYTFDPHLLLVTAIEDVLGNRIEGTPDYNVLASSRVRDANDNVSETRYDPLGVTTVTAVRGQQLGDDGTVHPVGADDLASYVGQPAAAAAEVLADPGRFLQNATRFLFDDLGAFARGEGPPRTILLERERHAHDGQGAAPTAGPIRVLVSYFDGFGREVQSKQRVDAGPAFQRDVAGDVVVDGAGRPVLADSAERWLTSGHVVFNNKGWAVRTYEPLFSTSPRFESDEALRHFGVATRTHYDPVGRVVRQELPNGASTSNAYSAWGTTQLDANDSVVGSDYESARAALPPSDPERKALAAAQAHAQTPTVVELDAVGRPFRLTQVGEGATERITLTLFGATGLPERIVDPRGLTAFAYGYDMLDRAHFERSMDAGDRWTLFDAQDRPLHQWDGRGVHTAYQYDRNGRRTSTRADGALGLDNVVERVVYGDEPVVPQAAMRNARGRIVARYDDAGVVRFDRLHMDGQIAESSRTLRDGPNAYRSTVDWATPAVVPLDGVQHRSLYHYDALGRIVSQTLPDGTTREFAYAAQGHVSEVRLTTADGQLQRKVIASAIDTNARGQRTRIRLGNGVETVYEYQPDTFRLGRLYTRRATGAPRDYLDVTYTYDPVGNITRWADRVQEPAAPTPLLQGLTVSAASEFTYDAFYQLKSATGRVHQALLEHDYRDGLPDPGAIKGTRHLSLNNGAAIERYTRLYDYDLSGNLQRIRHQGATRSWATQYWTSPTSNRRLPKQDLNGIEVTNPESRFDANGNTISLPHLRSVQWSYANRISRAVIIDRSGSGQPDDAEYYVYGADGLRVRRVDERLVAGQLEVTETTYFDGCEIRRISRAGNTRLLRQTSHVTDGAVRLATLHQWSVDQTGLETDDVARKKLHYLVGNHLGSVSLELDEGGDVISYEEYFPFGGTSFIAGDDLRDVKLREYRYSGKLRDDATGFYCYEYRYYAPFIGGWLSPDPLGAVDGLNLYQFVHNNPIRLVDPDGLDSSGLAQLGSVKQGLSKKQAMAQFNRTEGLQLGIQVTELRKEGNDWVIVSSRPIDPDVLESAQALGNLELAEAIHSIKDIDLGLDVGGGKKDKGDGDGGEAKKDGKEGDGDGDGPDAEGSGGEGDVGEGPGAGTKKEGTGGGGKGKTAGDGTKGSGKKAGSGKGSGTGATKTGTDAKPEGVEGGTGGPDGKKEGTGKDGTGSKKSGGTGKEDSGEAPKVPPGIPTGPGGIPYSPDMKVPEVQPEAGTPITDPRETPSTGGGTDDRSQPGTEGGTGVRPGGMKGGTTDGEGTASERGSGGAQGGGEGGEKGGAEGGMRGGEGWLTLPSWLSKPLNFIADKVAAVIDYVQIGLDIIGLIPGLGEIADGLNGLISLARGDYAGAALSFAAMIPFAGWAATAGKFGRRAKNVIHVASDATRAVTKYGDEAASVVKFAERHADEAAELVTKHADEVGTAAKGTSDAAGSATVHYRPNPDGTPHWTIETNVPGKGKLETHQTVPKKGSTVVEKVEKGTFPDPPAASKKFDLPDPEAARKVQLDQMEWGDMGKWDRLKNSCATTLCDVGAAGRIPGFPSNPAQAGDFLRAMFNIK